MIRACVFIVSTSGSDRVCWWKVGGMSWLTRIVYTRIWPRTRLTILCLVYFRQLQTLMASQLITLSYFSTSTREIEKKNEGKSRLMIVEFVLITSQFIIVITLDDWLTQLLWKRLIALLTFTILSDDFSHSSVAAKITTSHERKEQSERKSVNRRRLACVGGMENWILQIYYGQMFSSSHFDESLFDVGVFLHVSQGQTEKNTRKVSFGFSTILVGFFESVELARLTANIHTLHMYTSIESTKTSLDSPQNSSSVSSSQLTKSACKPKKCVCSLQCVWWQTLIKWQTNSLTINSVQFFIDSASQPT